MDLQLKGARVLVTGGSKGIGLACAESFAREGASIILASRDAGRLAQAADILRAAGAKDVTVHAADLALPAERDGLFKAFPEIDVLINNAGAIPGGNVIDMPMERWIESWQLKVFGYVHLMQLYLGAMRARKKGVIVNIIGMAGQAPRWDYACGAAGNAALIALTRAAGGKSVDWNVRVFGINPAGTQTDRMVTLSRGRAKEKFGDENRWEEMLTGLPFDRLAAPAEIADLAVMLSSPKAGYVSGTVIDVDGGQFYK